MRLNQLETRDAAKRQDNASWDNSEVSIEDEVAMETRMIPDDQDMVENEEWASAAEPSSLDVDLLTKS